MKTSLIAALGALLAAGAAQAQGTPELQALVKAADAERELTLVWSPVILGGGEGLARLERDMNAAFASHVKITFTPGGDLTQLGFQIIQEAKAGKAATSDIAILPSLVAARVANDDVFVPVEWQKLLPSRIAADTAEAGGKALRLASVVPGVTYNTRLAPNPPKTADGWLAEGYKGKLATTPYAAGFGTLAVADFWGRERGLAYAAALSQSASGFSRCGEENRIATGEFVALVFDCGGGTVELFRRKSGPIVDQVIPRDYAQIYFLYIAVPKNAAHPNAAKLFATYMMTEAAQKLAWETWGQDLHTLAGSQTAAKLAALAKDGIHPKVLDIAWAQAHPEAEAARNEVVKLFQTKGK